MPSMCRPSVVCLAPSLTKTWKGEGVFHIQRGILFNERELTSAGSVQESG